MAYTIRARRRVYEGIFQTLFNVKSSSPRFVHSCPAALIQNLLKFRRDKPTEQMERALDQCGLDLNDDLVLSVLRRHRSDWRPAHVFFNWASKTPGYRPSSDVCNEILDILGKTKRFQELHQVLDEMSKREGLIDEAIFGTLLRRFVGAHKVDEAIHLFHRRNEFGLELGSEAFRTLLMWLCRYKHVEDAEALFHGVMKKDLTFRPDIKTWNVILNGWCVLGNVHEAKRVWRDIVGSPCKPDVFTYGTFIKALTKKGKLGTALRLFRGMCDKGCKPDVVICNCIIDALCFKKRVPEALEVFREMGERGCEPNVGTYNTVIKCMCKIRRMEKVYELVGEMERRRGSCLPNDVTYCYLLKSLKEPGEVRGVLERMERNGCGMNDDVYNLVLRLYMKWDDEDGVRRTWEGMERSGWGPDRRSYTIMIHEHFEKGRVKDAMRYFGEMTSKGMVPEPRTEKLVSSMNIRVKGRTEKQEDLESCCLMGEELGFFQDIRKTVLMMKDIAVQLEKDNLSDEVKELEDAVIELVGLSELSVQFSSSVQAFANRYQPGEQFTNFNKIFEDELSKFRANQSSDLSKNSLIRQFKEAVWNVHHAGQPMPGEEQEDIVMTSTQSNILNVTCPLTGKPVTELVEPVRSMECRHIYEKKVIMQYLKSKQHHGQCPISGCPKILQADKLVQDPLLLIEIDEMRKMNKENDVEDYTMLDED
ncbi:putative pentatricopeptide repeat-containing protein [Spatholobus suberectus]|nr:putative pentatricopeptide repeat-containing protein [Spatholobus suberectus]